MVRGKGIAADGRGYMSTFFKGMLFTCGGLTVLGILVIGGIALVAGSMSSGGNQPAPGEPGEPIVIQVSGTDGIPFSGNYGDMEGGQSVDGTVPQSYETDISQDIMDMDILTANFQKNGAGGELTVEITRGDEVLASQTTTAEYGVVDVTWSPSDQ